MIKDDSFFNYELFKEAIEKDRENIIEQERINDLILPNEEFNYSFIKGISFENCFGPYKHDFIKLLKTANESISLWTHSTDKNSVLISKVNKEVSELDFFKNFGTLYQLASDFLRSFESVDRDYENEYLFIKDFNKMASLEDQIFYKDYNVDRIFINNGVHYKLTDLQCFIPLIELLNRDNRAYLGVSLLRESMISHETCLICELGRSVTIHHESHDFKIWEHASMLPRMESAIVQATRAVEALIGQPPNNDNQLKVIKKKEKWTEVIDINPDSIFEKSKMSYWDFYIKLFSDYRNPSAHSYGNINYNLKRIETINVQCFVFIILESYILKNIMSMSESENKFQLNIDLINRVDPRMSTPCTKDGRNSRIFDK